jgi:tRNA (guanine37-N1)-methyltransferase
MTKLKELLKNHLTEGDLEKAPSSFEIIGNGEKSVAIVEIPEELELKKELIAKAVMQMDKNVKSVLKKVSERKGEFRTREFEIIAGEDDTEVVHREYGYLLKVDPQIVYFSSKEGSERKRIAEQVKENEIVMLMFAGVGAIAVAIVKKQPLVQKIIAIELNPQGVKYIEENAGINRIADKIVAIEGDVRKEASRFYEKCDRVVMPLPLEASEFLEEAIKCLREKGVVHFYTLIDKEDFSAAEKMIGSVCNKMNKKYKILNEHKVSAYSPRKWKVCIDFEVLKAGVP